VSVVPSEDDLRGRASVLLRDLADHGVSQTRACLATWGSKSPSAAADRAISAQVDAVGLVSLDVVVLAEVRVAFDLVVDRPDLCASQQIVEHCNAAVADADALYLAGLD